MACIGQYFRTRRYMARHSITPACIEIIPPPRVVEVSPAVNPVHDSTCTETVTMTQPPTPTWPRAQPVVAEYYEYNNFHAVVIRT